MSVAAGPDLVRTTRGCECRVLAYGPPDGPPVVFFHGAAGLLGDDRFFDGLGDAGFRVLVPEMPGYGSSTGETFLEDMLDFTLHGWDIVDALGVDRPVLIGHGMGGMMTAEMAAVAPQRVASLVLVAPNGLWDDHNPVPDLFALLPFQFAPLLFADESVGAALLSGGAVDFEDMEALTEFFVGNSRRLGTAGKILFPIPNRRLSKRLYRVTAQTLLVWGDRDRYLVPTYAALWQEALPSAQLQVIEGAAHMVPYDRPNELVRAVVGFLT
ncbi:MAG: alpha/beta hydrolase [Acidimicrobiales bacterium]